MAEPVSSTIITNMVIPSVSVIIFGVYTGLDYATLIAGVIGGSTALSYREQSNLMKRAFEVITAALFAGYISPGLSTVIVTGFNKVWFDNAQIASDAMQLPCGFLIAYLAHGVILPGVRKMAAFWSKRYSE